MFYKYLDPIIQVFLHKINFNPAVRLSCRVKEPVVQYNASNKFGKCGQSTSLRYGPNFTEVPCSKHLRDYGLNEASHVRTWTFHSLES